MNVENTLSGTTSASSLAGLSFGQRNINNIIVALNEPDMRNALQKLFESEEGRRNKGEKFYVQEGEAKRFTRLLDGEALDWDSSEDRSVLRHLVQLCKSDYFSDPDPTERTLRMKVIPLINSLQPDLIEEGLIPHDLARLNELVRKYNLFTEAEIKGSHIDPTFHTMEQDQTMKLRHTRLMGRFIEWAQAEELPWAEVRELCRWTIAGRTNDKSLSTSTPCSFTGWASFFEAHLSPNEQSWKTSLLRLFGMAGATLHREDIETLNELAANPPCDEAKIKQNDADAERGRKRSAFRITAEGSPIGDPLFDTKSLNLTLSKLGLALPEVLKVPSQSEPFDRFLVIYVPAPLR